MCTAGSSVRHSCSRRHRETHHLFGHQLKLPEPPGSRYCTSSLKQQPPQMVETVWESLWYEGLLLLPAWNLEAASAVLHLTKVAACSPPSACTKGDRFHSRLPSEPIPTLQHIRAPTVHRAPCEIGTVPRKYSLWFKTNCNFHSISCNTDLWNFRWG